MTLKTDGRFTYNAGFSSYDSLVQYCNSGTKVIAIVGEAPSREDMAMKTPFSGASGYLLKSWLSLQGITWANCFITNVIGDRLEKTYTLQDKIAVLKELEEVKPSAILLVGRIALEAVLGIAGINYWRGSVLEWKGIKTIPVLNPVDVMRDWEGYPLCIADVGKLKTPYKPNPERLINYQTDCPMHLLHELADKTWDKIVIDIETIGEVVSIVGIGFSSQPGVWNYFNWNTQYWEEKEVRALNKLMQFSSLKIGHNLTFDFMMLWYNWHLLPAKPWFDTMLAWHAHSPELPKSLEVCSTLCCETKNWKGLSSQNLYYYNILDLWHTVQVYEHLVDQIQDVIEGFNRMMELVEPVIWMHLRGLKVNKKKALLMSIQYEEQLSQINLPFNPLSPKQVLSYMESLGVKIKVNRKTKKPTANEDSILNALKKTEDSNLEQTIKARELNKILGTYLNNAIECDRMKTSYNIAGTTSGRFSSSAGIFGGTNLQNWNEELRVIFEPDDGMVFLEVDLSQAEARVVAWLSQDELFMSFFKESLDAFTKIKEALKMDDRQKTKKLVHAVHYGMQAKTAAAFLHCSEQEAQGLINGYLRLFPGVARFQAQVKAKVQYDRVLFTPLGRKRIFYGRMNETLLNEALSYIPQSVVSDINKMGLVKIYNLGYDILGENHDATLLQVREEELAKHIPIVLQAMSNPVVIYGKTLTIPCSYKTGKNWKEMVKHES